jgi:hypothetical protein
MDGTSPCDEPINDSCRDGDKKTHSFDKTREFSLDEAGSTTTSIHETCMRTETSINGDFDP